MRFPPKNSLHMVLTLDMTMKSATVEKADAVNLEPAGHRWSCRLLIAS